MMETGAIFIKLPPNIQPPPQSSAEQNATSLCSQQAADFIQTFEGEKIPVMQQLNEDLKLKVEKQPPVPSKF